MHNSDNVQLAMRLTFTSIEVDERLRLTSKNPHASENDPNNLFFCSCPQLHRRIKKLSFLDQTHHASFPFLTRRISDLPFPTRHIMLPFLFGPDTSVIFLFGPDASRDLPFQTRRIKGPAFLGQVDKVRKMAQYVTYSIYVTRKVLNFDAHSIKVTVQASNSILPMLEVRCSV